MALIGNYTINNRQPLRQLGGGIGFMTAAQYSPHGSWKNRLSSFGQLSGTPYGYLAPISWVLPNQPGAMKIIGAGVSSGSATAAGGRAMEPVGAGTSIGSVAAGAVVPMVPQGAATSIGAVAMAGAAAMVPQGAATSTGSVAAGGIINILALNGSASGTGAVTLTALGFMVPESGGPTALSPEGLANAVLDALLADHNAAGTVGEALNNVGAGANPWSSDLSTNTTPGTFGERVQKLLTTAKFLGLK